MKIPIRRSTFHNLPRARQSLRLSLQDVVSTKSPWSSPMPHAVTLRPMQHRFMGSFLDVSPRDQAEIEERVWSSVGSQVKDPEIGKSLKDLGWMQRRLAISKDGTIQLLLKLPTLLHPSLDQLKKLVQDSAEREIRAWLSEKSNDRDVGVNVEAIATRPLPPNEEAESVLGPGLAHVSNFVAVYSCKGGVGKSTIAVNLAYELARMGGRVGLLDLDVYGPSLPILVKPEDPAVRRSQLGSGMVYPIEHEGVKLLSLGFVSPSSGVPGSGTDGGAAVLRGPMAGKVVTQLLKGTDWGDLDILLLDLPPGTGDVQLSLLQEIELTGAIGVTTPSRLAIADARKGIQMFSELGVPTVAMVENMSYFECDNGTRHFPFGKGFEPFVDQIDGINSDKVCCLPISLFANESTDDGVPLCLSRPQDATQELGAMEKLAQIVSRELLQIPFRTKLDSGFATFADAAGKFDLASMRLSIEGNRFVLRAFSDEGAMQKFFSAQELLHREPKTGKPNDPSETQQEAKKRDKFGMVEVHRSGENLPLNVTKKGKYGYEVEWKDGSKYIYSRRAIVLAAGGIIE